MGSILKIEIEGNSYVGAFGVATEKFAIISNNVSHKKEYAIAETLGVKVHRVMIDNSYLVGIYVAANSNGMLLPKTASQDEIRHIKKETGDFSVEILDSDMNALRNNILANDKIAIINPEYTSREEKAISDVLGVEAVRMEIGGFTTVGANNILTNKGMVLNNRVTEEETKQIERMVKLQAEQSTANLGSLNIGLCAIANSKGVVLGDRTTGFELARITTALGF
ncbi:MAG: translation initiation factor IF-6 [Candidatus Micrarchaeota archaeon]|nr:translation initiation factor IF-6 [Candidatus Micrarchaeota archaeon]MDE1804872.1 translation initiation factor IF-6 [Candidatus Micrarchaeota archaeon]MDE1847166.1 translation initiation factor IF-6 [Candidatus Micrarchaeota archaeon]